MIEEHHGLAALRDTADKILRIVQPVFLLGEESVHVTASIGISTYPHDGTDIQQLLTRADNAMYRAKTGGRNGVSFIPRS